MIHIGDCLTVLRTLPDASVQCCVTSPPYWGLRDYGMPGQLGLERTPGEYVARMVDVFREARRVLREDGTCWVNLGDSYATGGRGGGADGAKHGTNEGALLGPKGKPPPGLKHKDLVGIPWRVAFALQADGWYLRSDVVWHKPNPMPESVTDRPTKAHEYVFLLSKSERYFYDADAIAEPVGVGDRGSRFDAGKTGAVHPSTSTKPRAAKEPRKSDAEGSNGRNVQATNSEADRRDQVCTFNNNPRLRPNETRNARSVWTITTQPFPEAHFATFPEELPRRCILAGSRAGDTILDPFCGSGTTGAVADAHQRQFIGIELNPEYAEMARRRIERDGAPLFSERRSGGGR